MKLEFMSVSMDNGQLFHGKRIGELVEMVINKFSEEGLSCAEAEIVLDRTKRVVGEYAFVKAVSADTLEDNQQQSFGHEQNLQVRP